MIELARLRRNLFQGQGLSREKEQFHCVKIQLTLSSGNIGHGLDL